MKVFIGNAIWREVDAEHAFAMRMLCIEMLVRKIPWMDGSSLGDALVSRARSVIASNFLRSDADVLLSIDTDIEFQAEDAVQICEQAMTHDIVAGLYVSRGRGQRCKPTSHWLAGQEVRFGVGEHRDPTPVEILWAAGGFVAIHRRVFERLAQDLPVCHPNDKHLRHIPFYDPFPVDTSMGVIELSEDYAICERARNVGIKTYLNPAVRLAHWGVEPHRVEDMFVPEPPLMDVWLTHNADGSYTRVCPDGWWEHALDLRKEEGVKEVAEALPEDSEDLSLAMVK